MSNKVGSRKVTDKNILEKCRLAVEERIHREWDVERFRLKFRSAQMIHRYAVNVFCYFHCRKLEEREGGGYNGDRVVNESDLWTVVDPNEPGNFVRPLEGTSRRKGSGMVEYTQYLIQKEIIVGIGELSFFDNDVYVPSEAKNEVGGESRGGEIIFDVFTDTVSTPRGWRANGFNPIGWKLATRDSTHDSRLDLDAEYAPVWDGKVLVYESRIQKALYDMGYRLTVSVPREDKTFLSENGGRIELKHESVGGYEYYDWKRAKKYYRFIKEEYKIVKSPALVRANVADYREIGFFDIGGMRRVLLIDKMARDTLDKRQRARARRKLTIFWDLHLALLLAVGGLPFLIGEWAVVAYLNHVFTPVLILGFVCFLLLDPIPYYLHYLICREEWGSFFLRLLWLFVPIALFQVLTHFVPLIIKVSSEEISYIVGICSLKLCLIMLTEPGSILFCVKDFCGKTTTRFRMNCVGNVLLASLSMALIVWPNCLPKGMWLQSSCSLGVGLVAPPVHYLGVIVGAILGIVTYVPRVIVDVIFDFCLSSTHM